MQVDLLKDIVASVTGRNSTGIVDLLYNARNVNEFLIAKKLNLTINQTRTILYKLADDGLVSFIRKKDAKKGGWYTYFWTLNTGKSLTRFRDKLSKDLTVLRVQIEDRKSRQFFYCTNCTIEYSEESALANDYTCPECGEILHVKDNALEIVNLGKEIGRIEFILKDVNMEIEVISGKEEKARGRRLKAEVKKKEKERVARKKERAKIRAASKPKNNSKAKKKLSKRNSKR